VAVPAVLIKAATFAARAWSSRLYCHGSTLARYPWGHLASPYGQALKPATRRDVGGVEEDAAPGKG
jgi:hypothetical protein